MAIQCIKRTIEDHVGILQSSPSADGKIGKLVYLFLVPTSSTYSSHSSTTVGGWVMDHWDLTGDSGGLEKKQQQDLFLCLSLDITQSPSTRLCLKWPLRDVSVVLFAVRGHWDEDGDELVLGDAKWRQKLEESWRQKKWTSEWRSLKELAFRWFWSRFQIRFRFHFISARPLPTHLQMRSWIESTDQRTRASFVARRP